MMVASYPGDGAHGAAGARDLPGFRRTYSTPVDPFGPQERPMAGYVTIPADWPADTAAEWIGKSRPRPALLRCQTLSPA
ncbi:MAG TPA: hypothetical protein VF162_17920 [Streptosporangiaceae bacterium]